MLKILLSFTLGTGIGKPLTRLIILLSVHSTTVCDLGVYLDSKLSLGPHCKYVARKMTCLSFLFKNKFSRITPELNKIIIQSYLLPYVDYCSPVWRPRFAGDLSLVERALKRASCLSNQLKNQPYQERLNTLYRGRT